jgi:tetratricopeptide (TPR) repeat protein
MHYTDDDLSAYVTDPSRVPDREAIEGHLAECADCRARVVSLEEVEEELRDPAVWGQVDGFLARPARLEEALKLKAAIERENAGAVRLLTPLLAMPIRFAEANIAENPRFHTAGVVRMLCTEANGMHDKRPKFSLQLADAACAIAAMLTHPPSARLYRAFALRERANALRYLGRFAEALKALDEAEVLFDASPGADPYDRAIVGYIRGTVFVEVERAEEALAIAHSATEVFREYGDQRRELSSQLLEGMCLHTLGMHGDAAESFEAVIALARELNERPTLAYAVQAAAVAHVDLRAFERAQTYYAEALVLYDESGLETEKVRVEWALGGLAMARGELEAADRMLHDARAELQRLGLRNDHALATLEWVEVRLALHRTEGVVKACREILVQFDSEGMMRNARMALAHLHQALAKQNATPGLVRQISVYLKQLPHRPANVFTLDQENL